MEKTTKEIYKLFNGDIELVFDPKKHIYTIDDKIVYGSTGIISILAKPALVNWALNIAIRQIRDEINEGLPLEKALIDGRRASWNASLKARELGTRVHSFTDSYSEENKSELLLKALRTENEEERNSLSAFIEFASKNKLEKEFGERKIYSFRYNYAGTVDWVGKVNGKETVIDWKTSAAIYPSYFLQTASYAQALQEEFPEKKIVQTMIVRLGKDGKLEVAIHKNWKDDLPIFLSLLKVYEWSQNNKK